MRSILRKIDLDEDALQCAGHWPIVAATGTPEAVATRGVDGCGVPIYHVSLHALAVAFARLTTPETLPAPWRDAAHTVTAAMTAHPEMVAGTDRFDTALMRAAAGRLVSKGGAEAIAAVGAPGRRGVAIKIEDGAGRAVGPVLIETLRQLDLLTADEAGALVPLHRPPLLDRQGEQVGEILPRLPPVVRSRGPAGRIRIQDMKASSPVRQLAETLEAVSQTSRKLEKVARLAQYFPTLDDDDLRTACTFLTGAAFPAGDARQLTVGWAALLEMLQELTGAEGEALHDAYLRHGDLGEVAEELFAARRAAPPAEALTLARVRSAFEAIAGASGKGSRGLKVTALRELLADGTPLEAKYLVKIITSDLRVGLKAGLLEEAIAAAFAPARAGKEPERRALLPQVRRANMLISDIGEVAVLARYSRLAEPALALFHPFHFMLAETIFTPAEAFEPLRGEEGGTAALLVEDKYDGIRAQVHKADGRIAVYSRTLDDIGGSFPELLPALETLAGRYIIDGEVLAWRGERPIAFSLLQQRLRRKSPGRLMEQVPVVLFVFDVLHLDGTDLLTRPLRERRAHLEGLRFSGPVRPSYATVAETPEHLARRFREARDRGNEGLVVKRLDAPYAPGRRGRQWMKLKEELATLDAVVVAAEHGHGKRANVLSDVTFAVRDGDRLATIGKAYSGLTDGEIAEMTRWFREHTREDLGRVKLVEPAIVLEVAFDAVMESDRHDSGYALRFPRIKRWRRDKTPAEVNTLDDARRIYERQIVRPGTEEPRDEGAAVWGTGGGRAG